MGDNASLDDFLGGESSEGSEAADTGPAEETEPESTATVGPATDDTDVEPAATTYAWSDEGGACEACGETVERRWQQDGGLVCVECKDWARP